MRDDLENAIQRASAALLAIRRDPRNQHEDGDRRLLERVQVDILSTMPIRFLPNRT